MVRITLPEGDAENGQPQLHASRYQLYFPSEEELRAELLAARGVAEK